MKSINTFLLATILLLTLVSCGAKKKVAVAEEKPIAVTVAPAQVQDISVSKTYTGTLEGLKQAKIYSSIPEAIVDLPVAQGSTVQAGQPVIMLDKEGPSSHYQQAEAMYQDAKDNYNKMSKLYNEGAISEQTMNSLKTAYEVAKANFDAAKQQVELSSPISGILTDLSVNVGQYAPLGIPLATVAQTEKMRLNIYVDSRSASFIKDGQKAAIAMDIPGDSPAEVEGMVADVAKSADPDTRSFKVEIQIDNADKALKPGIFARATIIVEQLNNVLTVPREAVFTVEGIAKVFKLENGRAKEQSITVGEYTTDYSQVLSGLSAGDKVIILGRSQVEDGSLVKVVSGQDRTIATPDSSKEG
jgi:RND family efflux transporter MFP subunit